MFHQTIIGIEVLSEQPIPEGMSLTNVVAKIGNGVYSGKEVRIPTEVDGPTMAKLLKEQGTDPTFFGLPEIADGADICGGARCTRDEGSD